MFCRGSDNLIGKTIQGVTHFDLWWWGIPCKIYKNLDPEMADSLRSSAAKIMMLAILQTCIQCNIMNNEHNVSR